MANEPDSIEGVVGPFKGHFQIDEDNSRSYNAGAPKNADRYREILADHFESWEQIAATEMTWRYAGKPSACDLFFGTADRDGLGERWWYYAPVHLSVLDNPTMLDDIGNRVLARWSEYRATVQGEITLHDS